MDTSNRGFLTNDKVYSMLEEQAKLQKTLVTQRNLIIGLCVFAVILALANMGTAVSRRTECFMQYLETLDSTFYVYLESLFLSQSHSNVPLVCPCTSVRCSKSFEGHFNRHGKQPHQQAHQRYHRYQSQGICLRPRP